MQRMQILFQEPQLTKLRSMAKLQDRPVSELIRNAVDFYLSRYSHNDHSSITEEAPVYSCGTIRSSSETLRDQAYADRETI